MTGLAATDRELVDRVAKGDRAALRLLFMRHHARVYRFAVRQTGSEMQAEDVANEWAEYLTTAQQAFLAKGK